MMNRNALICLMALSLCMRGGEPPKKKLRYTAINEDEEIVNRVYAAANNPWQLSVIVQSNPIARQSRMCAFSSVAATVALSYPQHLPTVFQGGVPVNQKDVFGRTPLIIATFRDNVDVAAVLLEYKAHVSCVDDSKSDALIYALSAERVSATALQLLRDESLKPYINRRVCYPYSSKETTYLHAILKRTGKHDKAVREWIVTRLLNLGAHVGSDELVAGLRYQQNIRQLLPKVSVENLVEAVWRATAQNIDQSYEARLYGMAIINGALNPFLPAVLAEEVRKYIGL